MLPNLLLIGAMKCATSSICSYFERHPDVYFLPQSDPDFFSRDENWSRGIAEYERLFERAGGFSVIGEGSNSYSNVDLFPAAPARIKSILPGVKLVYSARHPIERIASAWAQLREQAPDRISHDINEAVRSTPEITVYPSYYWRQVSAYLECFPKEQIWIGFLEDLKDDAQAFFSSLCDFANIAPGPVDAPQAVWRNKTASKPMLGAQYTRLTRVPGAQLLKKLPSGVKDLGKRFMSTPTPPISELTARLELPDTIRKEIADDARQFLAFAGRRPDFWGLK